MVCHINLRTPEEALAAAETLREQGDAEAALLVGERGLSLEGRKVRLAGWVRDLAEGLGRRGLALEAALAASHADPSLASYLRVRELAGEAWPEHRERLLDHLRQSASYEPTGQVDIFLHENLVGDAIAAVEGDPFGGLVARVADAAIEREVAPTSTRCRSSFLRIALAAIILRSSPAAILLAGDCNESARGVGDAHPEGDRIVDATPRRVGVETRA
jgi:hypothetical protein